MNVGAVKFLVENVAKNGALGLHSDCARRVSRQKRWFSDGSSQVYLSRETTEHTEHPLPER